MKHELASFTRRAFCRTLALPAGALILGNQQTTWARSEKEGRPSDALRRTAAPQQYSSKVLWEFDAMDAGQNRKSLVCGYKGHAYKIFLLPGYQTMIAKIPLDGGKVQTAPLMPGHVTGSDPHRYYAVAVDSAGFIHVSGDMHGSAHVKHWMSKKPEDISEFVFTSPLGDDKRPQGFSVTYPRFYKSPDGVLYHSIRCAEPVWGIGISVLDVKTQTWTMLGADIPREDFAKRKRAKKADGKPLTAWEDNGEGGGYTQPHAHMTWDKNNRLHLAFGLLNEDTPSAKGRHTGSDVLYAYSDDCGKTFHRGDGTSIELPMRAEAGPHQADVVYSRHDGRPPWVGLNPHVGIDDKNRPVVRARDHKTGLHEFVLDNGKWTELAQRAEALSTISSATADDDDDDDMMHLRQLELPHKVMFVDKEYFRDTGKLIYQAQVPDKVKHRRIKIVLATPVNTKRGAR
ncbi:MAG: BNR-4 repeat-containing protein [Planctomycetales bacterium]|nr:BNR-4 repeat-containing protein [Planctomycetales bacterium]MBN8625872.1 BNR-4 repeat-containing protein [Planctomycetota bacterium]